jgi:OmpA-OmpF porin, OOP family
MKNVLFTLILSLPTLLMAQPEHVRTLEAGFLFGFNNYSGDVAQSKVVLGETRFGYGAFLRYQINKKFALRAHLYSGNISGDDKNNKELAYRKFKFSANLLEIGAVGEWHFLGEERVTSSGILSTRISPYFFLGVGTTASEPETSCYGTSAECAQYTDVAFPEPGLKSRYLTTPGGFGLKLFLSDRLNGGGEIGWRPVYSDYLDGIKRNGNPKRGDWYYFVGLSLSYVLNDPNKFRRD